MTQLGTGGEVWNFPLCHVGAHKVSDFGTFWSLGFQIREAQLALCVPRPHYFQALYIVWGVSSFLLLERLRTQKEVNCHHYYNVNLSRVL